MDKVYYCQTCIVALCPECFIEEHIGHQRLILKKVYEERKKSILEALEPIH